MSKYTVKFLQKEIKSYQQEIKEDKERIQKALLQIDLLQKQMKKAPKSYRYIYQDAIYELKRDEVLHYKSYMKENEKTLKGYQKELPKAVAYEQKNPTRAGESQSDRKNKLHLDKIREKAILQSRATSLARKITKAGASAHKSHIEPGLVIVNGTVKNLNRLRREVPELKNTKIIDVYKDNSDNCMRGQIRVVVK